jgi:GT2 family glycosyltransferase
MERRQQTPVTNRHACPIFGALCHCPIVEPAEPRFGMDSLLLDRRIHHDALALLGARALQEGDAEMAFVLADRRCRVRPIAGAEHFVLRAEAAWRLGHRQIALNSLRTALEIDPHHRDANRRMLLWAADDEKLQAARVLLHLTSDHSFAAVALRALSQSPEQIFVSAAVRGTRIVGWAAWRGASNPILRLLWEEKSKDIRLYCDPRHPLTSVMGNAASLSLEWPKGASEVALDVPGMPSFIAGSPLLARAHDLMRTSAAVAPQSLPATVIIPVYADFAATKACFDAILAPAALPDWVNVVAIDDATPEPPIAEMLDVLAERGLITLIRNQRNLGFVGSINRALRSIVNGDVILLNADTIVPPDFAARLFAAAHSAPDIATVTPLSNNGEMTSFPLPFQVNPLLDPDRIFEIDRIAAQVNAKQVVTIPNGIGFCLYIRRDCLARIGPLSAGVRRGYLEDVEFCLRARRHGLRNVCATSVYVGHAGARSFREEKRALVVRNLKSLESEYPRYRTQCAAFMALDPLRAARNSIQLRAPTGSGGDLLICGIGPTQEIAWARARARARAGNRVVVAELNANSQLVILSDAAGDLPQKLQLSIGSADPTPFLNYIRGQKFDRIEIADPAAVPIDLARALLMCGRPLDFFIADGGLFCPRGSFSVECGRHCGIPSDSKLCGLYLSKLGVHLQTDVAGWRREWASILEKCRTIWTPDPDASAFFELMFPSLRDRIQTCPDELGPPPSWKAQGRRLGLLPLGNSSTDLEFVLSLARAFHAIGSETELMVLGQTADDLRIMACGNALVSGAVTPEEVPALLAAFSVRGLLLGTGKALFGHPMAAAVTSSGVPIARFCWGHRKFSAKQPLTLDPLDSFEQWALQLQQWLSKLGRSARAVT